MRNSTQDGLVGASGTFVRLRYSLRTAAGEYVRGDPQEGYAYLEFCTGYDQVLPALEKRLTGKGQGERLEIRLAAEEAFGPRRADLVKERDYQAFPEGRNLEEGRWVVARDEQTRASFVYFVSRKEQDRVVVDYNHPLADTELVYDLEILEARPLTQSERVLLRPCEEKRRE